MDGPAGPADSRGRGDGPASASGAPHSLQNFADAPDSWPQRGQVRVNAAPQVSQKPAPTGLSNPQCAQRIRSLPLPGTCSYTF